MKKWKQISIVLICTALAVVCACEGTVCLFARDNVQGDPGAMVILGAQLRSDGPSLFLQRRLERALDYLAEHPDTLVVVSGGQGRTEPTTEAAGMEKFLRENGFSGNILLEDQATDTGENLKFSKQVLADAGYDVADGVVLVSNNFHLARCVLLGSRFGYNVSTLSAVADHAPTRVYNYLREPFALVKSFLFDW